MTSAVQDIWHELDAAERLPFGLERSALIEALVAQADELGDEKLALTTRLQLMTSYSYGGEPLRRFPVFAWLLDRYTATPELFDEGDRYRLLWMFKWVTIGVAHHPAVTRHRIEARLEQMAEHYAAAGEGPAPVLGCRYQVIAQLDGHEAAEEAFRAWTAAPRTALSDCEACEPGVRVKHFVATGHPAEALAEAESVLQLGGCADQPQRTIGYALEPLLQCGFGERAGYEHLRGVRLLRSAGGSPTTWARHIMACARGGQLRRGLDLLEDRLPELASAPTPWDAMWLSAAGARLLTGIVLAGDGELPVAGAISSTGATATVEVLLTELTESARDLAARFDERNQSLAVGEHVERWLNAPVLPELQLGDVVAQRRPAVQTSIDGRRSNITEVPPSPATGQADRHSGSSTGSDAARPDPTGLDPTRPDPTEPDPTEPDPARPDPARPDPARPDPARSDAARSDAARPDQSEPDPSEPDQSEPARLARLADRWQAALDSGIEADRTAVLSTWRRVRNRPVAAQVSPATSARLEAALAIDALDAGTVSLHDARGAARLLRETGDAVGALLHELACLRREPTRGGDPGTVLARAESLVAKNSQLAGPASVCLYVGLVALRQTLGLPTGPAVEQGLQGLASVDPAGLGVVQRGCLALLLRDRAARLDGPERETALERALALLGPGERVRERALVALALATSLEDSGALVRARELLADAADDAAAAGDPGLSAHAAHALGRVCQLTGDLPAAIDVFRNLLAVLGPDADPLLLAQARQDLAHALHDSGAGVVAAELAETALEDLEGRLADNGLITPDDLDWAGLGEAVTRKGLTEEDLTAADGLAEELTAADDVGPEIDPNGDDGRGHPNPHGAGREHGADREHGDPAKMLPEAGLAGTLAFTAALFARDLGEDTVAAGLAQRSAAWHRTYGAAEAEAESLELAAEVSPDPWEAAGMLHRAVQLHARDGRWIAAAAGRRRLTLPLLEVAGLGAAEHALVRAQAALETVRSSDSDQHRLAWERVALADQAARMLAAAGQLDQALQACQELDTAFRALHDASSARDVIGLRAQMLEELGRGEECLTELHEAALEALSAGDERQALQLGGYLAAFLDDLGRHDEAETIWQLFTP